MDQAGPSTASSSRSRQYASFIFDPSIPRARYTELIQRNGVVHSLVKRLMEKHSGDNDQLFLDVSITSSLPHTAHKRQKGRERLNGFTAPTAFLGRLPSLIGQFGETSNCKTGDPVIWPSFGQQSIVGKGERKRKRREEVGLMAGVASGLEDITLAAHVSQTGSIPSILTATCPTEARPLLESLYTPPSTATSAPGSSKSPKYIFIFAQGSSPSGSRADGTEGEDIEWKPKIRDCCREAEWGETDWDEISSKCGDIGAEVSLVLLGSDTGGDSKRLKSFVHNLNPNPPTPPWFPLPSGTFAHLTSLSLSPVNILATSTTQVPASTPLGNPSESQPQLQPTQAMAMRFLAQRGMAPNSSSPGVSAALQNFLTAAKNGNVDPNDPQMAHFKQMIMMQQQAAQAQSKTQVPNQSQSQEEQLSVAASVQRQKAVQAMQQVRMQQEQGQGRPNQPSTAGSGGAKMKVWSGDIVWPTQGSSGGIARLSVECTAVNNGNIADTTQIAALIPPELRIISSMQADINFLQAFVRENKVPVLQFSLNSEYSTTDPSHGKRFESLITGLSSKGTAGVVHIGGNDRGMLLCTAPVGNGQLPRLLGVLCLSIPLPTSFTRQPTNPPPQPTSIQAPRLNAPMPQRQQGNGPVDLPAPYNPAPPQQPMSGVNPAQLKMLIEQAIKVGIDVPPNINPTQITPDQLKGLINSIRIKGAQSRQQMAQQQQVGGVDPRLMAGASVDPRLMQAQDGLAQMQMEMTANISRGSDGTVGGNPGYQYR